MQREILWDHKSCMSFVERFMVYTVSLFGRVHDIRGSAVYMYMHPLESIMQLNAAAFNIQDIQQLIQCHNNVTVEKAANNM